MEIDYKELLAKYIEHVGECEGVDFIPKYKDDEFSGFSNQEIDALWECAKYDPEKRRYYE